MVQMMNLDAIYGNGSKIVSAEGDIFHTQASLQGQVGSHRNAPLVSRSPKKKTMQKSLPKDHCR